MIITVQKPLPEILDSLKDYDNVFIVGCAACATKCQTGGEEAVKKISEELKKAGKKVSGSAVLDTPCDIRVAKRDLKNVSAGVFLILGCGAGVQSVEKVTSAPLVPALDPVFTGTVERIGIYHEYCALCGSCMLAGTGGICPITRCAKSLINGPCGGAVNGKCEADPDSDCAWALILEKTKGKGILKDYMPPRSFIKPKNIGRHKKTTL
ncbi:MAG TPA: 5,10-methylenetetrahydrofolate reductase [Elusimicrobia bacterium]|nr:MAG: hypothetical protein A2278_06680 [Elusimicrobia bacterium RIFOXYA12_FULL_49_49]OGS10097.1 MAG: hypothetical protein A2204_06935 [Elusimicrobia bacterium RIFOXYA1_FULL_47_7]OGS16270.1 MAG: hypothetical protein A2251_01505 [Elusimicrobia bacterium RIFOXYA2_FULL_47_53]OGS26187.1 MAG: hypothetical protein A2339_02590 [Elusimicrobia bacterium RIFOXYB12_FULL_50_12]OGS31425.1 MAG: hypothetical protein A2323_09795 [Elusimicrobia bacterium RIFOXYB2_FULL_46_23]HBU70034.1 5,10-methylenetetrahydro